MPGQLRELLSWSGSEAIARAIHARHLGHLRNAVAFWLAIASRRPAARAAPLEMQFGELPRASRLRLLTAPETYRRLVFTLGDSSNGTIDFFADSLRAERCLLGLEARLARPVWTARGDAYFPAGAVRQPRRGIPDPKGPAWRAPAIARGPTIDGVSPYGTVERSDPVARTVGHSPPELALVVRRVRDAAARIGGVNAHVLATLRMFTTVIVCRSAPGRQAGFSSSSWPALVGKTAVLNAHHPDLGVERIANALIHEAIHAVLFATEACEAFAVDSPRVERATAVSPWSRRPLLIRNYLHACFVWYGLWCFWRLALQTGGFAPAAASSLFALAGSGFRGPSLVTPLTPLRRYLAPAVLDAIHGSQETVVDNSDGN